MMIQRGTNVGRRTRHYTTINSVRTIAQERIEMFKNNEIADLKNYELKAFLKSQGERLSGKKVDLVNRVHR